MVGELLLLSPLRGLCVRHALARAPPPPPRSSFCVCGVLFSVWARTRFLRPGATLAHIAGTVLTASRPPTFNRGDSQSLPFSSSLATLLATAWTSLLEFSSSFPFTYRICSLTLPASALPSRARLPRPLCYSSSFLLIFSAPDFFPRPPTVQMACSIWMLVFPASECRRRSPLSSLPPGPPPATG